MRISRAIDRFLEEMQLESDWTARTVASYFADLIVIVNELGNEITFKDLEGRDGTEQLRRVLGTRWGRTSPATRARVISEFHSFFSWAEDSGLIDDDPARRIKRPPKRKPKVYRPTDAELLLGRRATTLLERAAWLLMEGGGLRVSDVTGCQWRRIDLTNGQVQVYRKGHNWQWVPLSPDVVEELRQVHIALAPDPDHYVFVSETEQWLTNEHRVRAAIDPTTPRTGKAVWSMVRRVCKRAGIPPLHPHLLRHGFANRFVRDSRRALGAADVQTLQFLLGHSRIDTTQRYIDELQAEEAAEMLARIYEERLSQASPEEATADEETSVSRNRWSGGGGNRTRVRPEPEPSDRPQSNADDPDPRITPAQGGHE